jgi:DNA helicase HerA-like ATPase
MLTGSVRLDLSKLPDQIRFVATETLLRKIFRTLRLRGPIPVQPADDRQRFRLFVVIDEAKILALGGGERDRADNILNELITEARKFGLGMILASQMSDHFSEEVRANAATWLVLKPMDVREAKKNAPNVQVDPEDLIRLTGRGDGYYRDRPSTRARRIQVRPVQTRS